MDRLNQKISSIVALTFLFLGAFLVAWFALAVGDDIIKAAPNSKSFNPAERNLN
jgi:hypothetical protein